MAYFDAKFNGDAFLFCYMVQSIIEIIGTIKFSRIIRSQTANTTHQFEGKRNRFWRIPI